MTKKRMELYRHVPPPPSRDHSSGCDPLPYCVLCQRQGRGNLGGSPDYPKLLTGDARHVGGTTSSVEPGSNMVGNPVQNKLGGGCIPFPEGL